MAGSESGTALGSLLGLVSRAQALVAELLRLSDRVPPAFIPEQEPKYADILYDFRYLKVHECFPSQPSVIIGRLSSCLT